MHRTTLGMPAAALLAAGLLAGCSGLADSPGITIHLPVGTGAAKISGDLYGGQAPIVGANIYAFSSNVAAYGGPGITSATGNVSTSLIAAPGLAGYGTTAGAWGNYIQTDKNGYFEISSSTPCTPGSITYLYSVSGNPGAGTNTAAGEMVALGVCPSTGSNEGKLVGSIGSATHIHMNEISTVAAAYALAGYASDATHVGAPFGTPTTVTTGSGATAITTVTYADTLAETGIHNAVNNASQLYNYNTTTSGSAGDAGDLARTSTPNGNGTVPQQLIDSLANSIAACINSAGSTSSQCSILLGDALSGGTSGTKPTDTATAAINIAHNPTANVTAIYNNGASQPAFGATGTILTAAPNDWSVTIVYTGGGITANVYNSPRVLSIDAGGNAWVANFTGNTVSEFTPLGVPTSTSGYATGTRPFSVAIDGSGNAWTANLTANTLTKTGPLGASTTPYTPTGPALNEPTDAEFDGSGNIFVSNLNADSVSKLSSAAVTITSSTADTEGVNSPYTVTLEPGTAGAVWVTNSGSRFVSYFTNALAGTSDKNCYTALYTAGYTYTTTGGAIDSSGNMWFGYRDTADPNSGYLCEDTTANSISRVLLPNDPNVTVPDGIAIDGNNNVWVADADNGVILEVSSAGTVLSGTYGFELSGNSAYTSSSATITNDPNGIAVDGSGDVWYTAATTAATAVPTLNEIIGIGVPTYTPISLAVKNSKLGQEP